MEHGNTYWYILLVTWALTYFVYRDSEKKQVPYRNVWIVMTFLFWPTAAIYFLFRSFHKKAVAVSPKIQREIDERKKMKKQVELIKEERKSWAQLREEERKKMQEANKNLDSDIAEIKQKRMTAKEKRMAELAKERKMQELTAAGVLHMK